MKPRRRQTEKRGTDPNPGRIKQKIFLTDPEIGREAVAKQYAYFWTFFSMETGVKTFSRFEDLERFATESGYEFPERKWSF